MQAKDHRLKYYLSLSLHERINFKAANLYWDNFLRTPSPIMYRILNAQSYIQFNKPK